MDGISSSTATPLGEDVHLIDTRMGGYDGITAAYLIRSSRPALVETGAARSAQLVVDELAALGVGPADLATSSAPTTSPRSSSRTSTWTTPAVSATWRPRSRTPRWSSTSAVPGTWSIRHG